MGKVFSTLVVVVVAVAASAGIWIVANLIFNLAKRRWQLFNTMVFAAIGFVLGAILSGNRLTIGSPSAESGGFLAFIWLPVVAALVFAVLGTVLEQVNEPRQRLLISAISGVAIGVAIGVLIREQYRPALEIVPLVGGRRESPHSAHSSTPSARSPRSPAW